MNITLVCEDSFEGIMTAVYDAWVLMNQGHQYFSGKQLHADLFFRLSDGTDRSGKSR